MSETPRPPIANIDDVLADPENCRVNADRGPFAATIGLVGRVLATPSIGINATVVPPGKKAWPRHFHYVNDEIFVILAGAGTLNYGDDAYPLKPGDVVSITAGQEIPFQIENNGAEELRYLSLSTLHGGDVIRYPDSGKIGVFGNRPQLRAPTRADAGSIMRFISADHEVDYWDGELPKEQD